MSKPQREFDFVTVGIKIYRHEFYVNFAVPRQLQMRTTGGRASFRDWLVLDFEHVLAVRLHLNNPTALRLVCVDNYRPSLGVPYLVYQGNALPDSWTSPFVRLIAETFVNNFAHGC